jgi:DNA repair exonuclease SbcCD ATPase subunit
MPSNLSGGSTSAAASPVDAAEDEDARAETAALIQELKERLQKAEAASEEYAKQVEVLQLRVDDALKEQANLEERVHEEEERTEGLENEKREALRQHRELEGIYEAERAQMMKEKEEAVTREEELHEIIQRLKDGLSQRELRPGNNEEEGRLSRTCEFSLPPNHLSMLNRIELDQIPELTLSVHSELPQQLSEQFTAESRERPLCASVESPTQQFQRQLKTAPPEGQDHRIAAPGAGRSPDQTRRDGEHGWRAAARSGASFAGDQDDECPAAGGE